LIEYDGEKYITATEVARRLEIPYGMCSRNVLPTLTECRMLGKRRSVYKLSEVEQLSMVRVVEKHSQPLTLVKQDHKVARIEDSLCKEAL